MKRYSCEWCGSTDDIEEWHNNTLCQDCLHSPSPKRICLCGSTRFYKQFQEAMFAFTLQGHIVLTIGCDTKQDDAFNFTVEQKRALDRLHMRKILWADEIFVINVGGYIGESTTREIAFAKKRGIPINYLEAVFSD